MPNVSDLITHLKWLCSPGAEALSDRRRLTDLVHAGAEAAETLNSLTARLEEEQHTRRLQNARHAVESVAWNRERTVLLGLLNEAEAALKPFADRAALSDPPEGDCDLRRAREVLTHIEGIPS